MTTKIMERKKSLDLNLDFLEKVQTYCDRRAYTEQFGHDGGNCEWDETPAGRIGLQLSCISASIEEIFEQYPYCKFTL